MDSIRVSMAVRASLTALAGSAIAFYAPAGLAQQASGSAAVESGQLEEILITAQKRTEKLEDVPVAASVLSAEVLAQQNVSDISDINKLVPSEERRVGKECR